MRERASVTFLVPAIAAIGLVLLHLAGKGPEPIRTHEGPQVVRPVATPGAAERAREINEERRQAFRDKHNPSILDTGEERELKELYVRMKTLGTTPVELVSRDASEVDGIRIAKSQADLDQFLNEGGHYSGPLPERMKRVGAEDQK